MPDFVLSAKITARDTVKTTFDKAEKAVDKFGKTTRKSFDKASRSQKNFTTDFLRGLDRIERRSIGAGGIIRGTLGADIIRRGFQEATRQVGSFITEAGKVERATTEFQVLLRSMEKGAKLTETLRELSAVTPFQFENLARTTKLLLAMRAATEEDLIPTLRMLGDAAGGSSVKLERIAFAFGEVKANSKASFQEIRQFTNAGVPMLATLADMWGKNMQQARKMVRMGKATGPAVAKAFKIMTSEGGIFFRGMERTSKDFEGRMSTLIDNIKIAKATIGEQLLPTVKEYVDIAIDAAKATAEWAGLNKKIIKTKFLEWIDRTTKIAKDFWPALKLTGKFLWVVFGVVEKLSPILPVLAAGWLANKIALKAVIALEAAKDIILIAKAVRAAGIAQGFWNLMIIANPIGLMVTAVIIGLTLITAGIFLLVKNWDFVTKKITGFFDIIFTAAVKLGAGLLRILIWPLTGLIKAIGFFGQKVGKALGIETMEKEFGALSKIMDDLIFKLEKTAGLRKTKGEKPIVISKGFIDINKLGFAGVPAVTAPGAPAAVEPGLIQFKKLGIEPGTFDFSKIPKISKADREESLSQIDRLLSLQKTALDFAPLLFDKFIRTGKFDEGEREERSKPFGTTAEMPFPLPPETIESFNFETIRHLVQLDVNAPEGSKVSVRQTGTSGGGAPPVEINTLGAN